MPIENTEAMNIILKLQDDYRRSALLSPKGKKAYDYGEVVGVNKGLSMAIQALAAEEAKQEAAEKAADQREL
jgi:hypothetical protein